MARTEEQLEAFMGESYLNNIAATYKVRRSKRQGFTKLEYGVEKNRREEMIGTVDAILMDDEKKEGIIDKLERLSVAEAEILYKLIKNHYMDDEEEDEESEFL